MRWDGDLKSIFTCVAASADEDRRRAFGGGDAVDDEVFALPEVELP